MSDAQNTTAWAVPIWTDLQGDGGPRTLVLYAALATSDEEAVDLVKSQVTGDEIGEVAQLESDTARQLGLRPGEVRML